MDKIELSIPIPINNSSAGATEEDIQESRFIAEVFQATLESLQLAFESELTERDQCMLRMFVLNCAHDIQFFIYNYKKSSSSH